MTAVEKPFEQVCLFVVAAALKILEADWSFRCFCFLTKIDSLPCEIIY